MLAARKTLAGLILKRGNLYISINPYIPFKIPFGITAFELNVKGGQLIHRRSCCLTNIHKSLVMPNVIPHKQNSGWPLGLIAPVDVFSFSANCMLPSGCSFCSHGNVIEGKHTSSILRVQSKTQGTLWITGRLLAFLRTISASETDEEFA